MDYERETVATNGLAREYDEEGLANIMGTRVFVSLVWRCHFHEFIYQIFFLQKREEPIFILLIIRQPEI